MDIEAQIQLLINNAPQDGTTPQLVSAIAPCLRTIAQKLRHSQYYILQNLQQSWVLTTLSNRANPQQQKHVIYAFSTIQDASVNLGAGIDPQIIIQPIFVTHILFQLLALKPVDSIIFCETPGTTPTTIEIGRSELQKQIQYLMQNIPSGNSIPNDIA